MDFSAWAGGASINESVWAMHAWGRIQRRPSAVVMVRGTVAQLSQTVRVELKASASERLGAGPLGSSVRAGVVFGVRNHPTLPDANIRRGDIFVLGEVRYRVLNVARYPGEVQASVEAMQ